MDEEFVEQIPIPIWLPENEGDELMGVVVKIVAGDYGKQLQLKDEEGIEHLTPSHKVLQSRLREAKVGVKVKIVFDGTEPSVKEGKNPTQMYKVFFGKKK